MLYLMNGIIYFYPSPMPFFGHLEGAKCSYFVAYNVNRKQGQGYMNSTSIRGSISDKDFNMAI